MITDFKALTIPEGEVVKIEDSFGRVLWQKQDDWYITDGLICHLDGIDNIARGVHDSNAATWIDLTGNGHNVPIANYIGTQLSGWESDALAALNCYNVPFSNDCKDYITIEIGFLVNGYQAVFNAGDGEGGARKIVAILPSNGTIQFYNRANANAPYISNNGKVFAAGVHYPAVESPLVYSNGEYKAYTASDSWNTSQAAAVTCLGRGRNTAYNFKGKYYFIRLYNRALTADEIAHNFEIDKVRFNVQV